MILNSIKYSSNTVMHYQKDVNIMTGNLALKGTLSIPIACKAIIVFSHGSGNSRFNPHNQSIARYLNQHKFGTLLFDLLTEEEEARQNHSRFDIDLLAKRLIGATRWLQYFPASKNCRIAYFGAGTGAASALQAAARLTEIFAVVSRGGRPDMAGDALQDVEAPTLLIVGSRDKATVELNKKAFNELRCLKELFVVEGASQLLEEKGTMEKMERLAVNWFEKYAMLVPAFS